MGQGKLDGPGLSIVLLNCLIMARKLFRVSFHFVQLTMIGE